nr:hypothetical protein [Pandoravirus aubagnensis]
MNDDSRLGSPWPAPTTTAAQGDAQKIHTRNVRYRGPKKGSRTHKTVDEKRRPFSLMFADPASGVAKGPLAPSLCTIVRAFFAPSSIYRACARRSTLAGVRTTLALACDRHQTRTQP